MSAAEKTAERRAEILSQLIGDAPLTRSTESLCGILELDEDEDALLDDDLRALHADGLIEETTTRDGTPVWSIAVDTDEKAVRAGIAALAAGTIPMLGRRASGPWSLRFDNGRGAVTNADGRIIGYDPGGKLVDAHNAEVSALREHLANAEAERDELLARIDAATVKP